MTDRKMPTSAQRLIIGKEVLELLFSFAQGPADPEAGGLLFAEFNLPEIKIVEASLPGKLDKRTRTLFEPNRSAQRQLIKRRFKEHKHFIGEWHTHPQDHPSPSSLDLFSMSDAFLKSRHELDLFIMVIVGNRTLWVSAHNGTRVFQLKQERTTDKEISGNAGYIIQ